MLLRETSNRERRRLHFWPSRGGTTPRSAYSPRSEKDRGTKGGTPRQKVSSFLSSPAEAYYRQERKSKKPIKRPRGAEEESEFAVGAEREFASDRLESFFALNRGPERMGRNSDNLTRENEEDSSPLRSHVVRRRLFTSCVSLPAPSVDRGST